ncbi:MAG: DUF1326 domain-containing protein [Gemmatimonadales bacterium]|nr:DUF1326 domain-containing protein [Gemmatimonadales bacterium]
MAKPAKWSLKVEHLMACNCNYACPCSFDARPTFGTCEASTATRIVKGKVDGVTLDGLKWAFVAKWPGPLHELHGRGVVFLDHRARGAKRDALERVATGKAGGPWGIFMSTVTDGYQVRTAGIEFKVAGKRSHFRVVGATEVAFESIKNPLTGADYPAIVLLPAGLLTKKEEIFAAKTMWVKADGLDFSYPQRNALVFTTTWRGP